MNKRDNWFKIEVIIDEESPTDLMHFSSPPDEKGIRTVTIMHKESAIALRDLLDEKIATMNDELLRR